MVSLRVDDSPTQALADIARGACAVAGIDSNPWKAVRGDWKSAVAMTVEIVDETSAWVLLDDVHKLPLPARDEFLSTIAAYARKSKWLATSRELPTRPELDNHVFRLPVMSTDDLSALARARLPSASNRVVADAVQAAAGSPWHLLQVTAATRTVSAESISIIAELPEGSRALLETLAVLKTPLPLDDLLRLVPSLTFRETEHVERLGLIENVSTGFRLHDVARPLVENEVGQSRIDTLALATARTLATAEDIHAALEAVRIFLEHDALNAAWAILRTREDQLITEGYASQLWHLLKAVRDERFRSMQIRIAVAAADPAVLDIVPEPGASDFDGRLAWSQALFLRKRDTALSSYAKTLADDAATAGRNDIAFEAGMLAGLSLLRATSVEAEAIVRSLRPATASHEARQAALLSVVYAGRGDREQAVCFAEKAIRQLPHADNDTVREVVDHLSSTYLSLGLIDRAKTVFDRWLPDIDKTPLLTLRDRFALLTFFHVNTFGGRFERARALRAGLEALTAHSDVLWLTQALADFPLDIAVGNFEGIYERIDRAVAGSGEIAATDYQKSWFLAYRVHAAMLFAESRGVGENEEPSRTIREDSAQHLKIMKRLHQIREAESISAEVPSFREVPSFEDAQCWLEILRAMHALRQRRAQDAETHARTAMRSSERSGDGMLELEARAALCDVLLASDSVRDLRTESQALARRAKEAGSPRFEHEARFFSLCASKDPLDLAALFALATVEQVAPVASRRARCLIGAPANRDRIDELVLAAIASHVGQSPIDRVGPSAVGNWDHESWGIDDVRQAVILPGARVVDLAKRPTLWQALIALADRGGTIDSAELFSSIWKMGDFHPLRHAARVYKTIHDLRLGIEDDPEHPTRVITTETGYALGTEATVWRRRVTEKPAKRY